MHRKRPYSLLLILLRLPLLLTWLIVLPLPALIVRLISPTTATEKLPMLFHKGLCRLFGLHVKVNGALCRHRPTLYISNHVSYLDIFALGSQVPAYFIAKSEVAGWPLLGKLARLQNTLFIERNSRHARRQVDVLQQQLIDGGNLILFPEGTSTDGAHVKPFKSSLFHAAETGAAADVYIQPMTLAYTQHKHRPMPQAIRDYYAWYDDMPFLLHFIKALGMRNADIELVFHEPVQLQSFESRKACAEYCWQQVSQTLNTHIPFYSGEVPDNVPTAPSAKNSPAQ